MVFVFYDRVTSEVGPEQSTSVIELGLAGGLDEKQRTMSGRILISSLSRETASALVT